MHPILQILLKHKLVTDEIAGKVRAFIAANQTFKAGEASKKKEEAKPKRCRLSASHHQAPLPLGFGIPVFLAPIQPTSASSSLIPCKRSLLLDMAKAAPCKALKPSWA